MARPLFHPKADRAAAFVHAGAPAASVLLLAAAVVAAVVVSLCTSGKHARPRKQRRSPLAPAPQEQQDSGAGSGRSKPQLLASLSGIGVKAAAVAKMVSWTRRSPPASGGWSSSGDDGGGGAAAEEEEALWKKTIIMGGKCRPLESSGHIGFGSDGCPLQPPPPAPVDKDAADEA
ncbi:uncharacterized protein C2845_PM07G04440 [Panicum miliaceum]|uniref:Uncharacterized protein n=1 Tax=Panicum miliaceum TaxID=4540 RepID=A0A3L6SH98_PANMI|nr:uncharacterized protein C2845_PM07G04440 [Panicum miliaceum]